MNREWNAFAVDVLAAHYFRYSRAAVRQECIEDENVYHMRGRDSMVEKYFKKNGNYFVIRMIWCLSR